MSITTLLEVKQSIRQTHDDDDALLQRLIDSAESEAMRFIGATATSSYLPDDVINGVILMVQADYDGDPLMRQKYRDAAEALWMPHATNDRTGL